ncbi:hypothetical protein XM38_024060 [Halomicronema hongdechloris C2206]|uniref:O-antigen ligase-related domain-containing protein n=1 Tax=Halomicronema hongdechloris C2206 TaxID=1641165 RepID=A0A1Z3HMC8_9CYAN|nr:O-antigen ligase family protein [Halomicronema hongdechloris]ASC71454.1 hypothetical protein XM38_024060 [Halomicronema hongdechloris C2206]
MKSTSTSQDGTLLGLLTVALYAVFTLLPGSSTMMVSWPWVFLWQAALALPILWLLWQLWHKPLRAFRLGGGLDWIVALGVIGLIVSTLGAEFPQQARWYGWAALGGVAAVYALRGWLTTPRRCLRLLQGQGGLAIAFILVSLGLWLSQIYWPELARLETLQQYGVEQSFNFNLTSLRNWQPIGHQNYVAGYLVLMLPLLAGLAWVGRGWQRWLWLGGGLLGLVDLYTTSSRGGWLALIATAVVALAVALLRSPLPKKVVLPAGAVGVIALVGLALANPRIRQLVLALLSGRTQSGELAYRFITNAVGWAMGKAHPWSGIGLGGVPVAYQAYRPAWAGREAELQFQLHGTPAQLWAELGIWGILIPLLLSGWGLYCTWRWLRHPSPNQLLAPLVWSLLAGLLACGLISLTDYQLDILCISGGLALYGAVLATTFHSPGSASSPPQRITRGLVGLGLGLTVAMGVWLVPIHRAWQLSSQGFAAIRQDDLPTFVQTLERAHQLAPWEPYYPYQLGWKLGDLSYQAPPEVAERLRRDAITWFQRGLKASPYQEFGHSNLGWLQVQVEPKAAVQSFTRSAQLVPAKQGVFFGLGFSLLRAGQPEQATEAMVLELLRHPLGLTSPVWQTGQFSPLYAPMLASLEARYSEFLEQLAPGNGLTRYLHQLRGSLRWWQGDLAGAEADWTIGGTVISRAVLDLAQGQPVDAAALPDSPGKFAILAWQTPSERRALLEKAWVTQPEDLPQLEEGLPPPEMIDQLVQSMRAAESFDQWLHIAPTWEPRSKRLGFGVLSRHIDGLLPADYLPRIENVAMVKFFEELLPSPTYRPEWDRALQPQRQGLIQSLAM